MEQFRQALGRSLRRSDVDGAVGAARQWAAQSDLEPRALAVEIAREAGAVYRELISQPVEEFVAGCQANLPAEIAGTIEKAVGRLVEITREWEPRVRSCYEERLARELRDMLREKNFTPAAENVARLVQPSDRASGASSRAQDVERRALYVGNVLGTLLHNQREADHLLQALWRKPDAVGLTPELVKAMKQAKDERHGQMLGANVENLENQWTATLRETQIEILNRLPSRNQMGEPEEDDLRDIGDIFRAVLRVPLEQKQYRMLVDSTLILVDFLPKETALAARTSGIEGRSYAQMGFRARKAVALVLMDIGKIGHFAKFYLDFARRLTATGYIDPVVELMGALRNPDYESFFVELWDSGEHKRLREPLSVALGNLASPRAADFMLEELKDIFSRKATSLGEQLKRINEWKLTDKAFDPATVKRAERVLTGLGRIVRSPRADEAVRRRIIETVVDIVPQDDRRLAEMVVTSVMAPRPEDIPARQRQWAIGKLVDAMWVQDQSTEMHRGGDRQENILGTRAEHTEALKRLGQHDPDSLLAALDVMASRFGGAYLAAADVLESIDDPRSRTILHKMMMNAAMFDENQQNAYQQETYWDATEQRRKPLTRDKIMATVVHALGTLGGPDAMRSLEELSNRIQMGSIRIQGGETVGALARYLKLPEHREQPAASAATAAPHGGPRIPDWEQEQFADAEEAAGGSVSADPDEVRQLIKAISGTHLLTGARKRAEKKIQALVRLGQVTPEEALEAIFENLTDKDPMVASAALTTLSEYAAPGKPPILTKALLNHLEEALVDSDTDTRLAARKLIKEIGPNRPPMRKALAEMARRVDHPDSRRALEEAIGERAALSPPPTGQPGSGAKPSPGAAPKSVQQLELKRQYMEARRRWIEGGKRGDPPAPPPGL